MQVVAQEDTQACRGSLSPGPSTLVLSLVISIVSLSVSILLLLLQRTFLAMLRNSKESSFFYFQRDIIRA